jgi:hypothetical protein
MLRSSSRLKSTQQFVPSERIAEMRALNELIAICSSRNNKLRRGDMKAILDKYHKIKAFLRYS